MWLRKSWVVLHRHGVASVGFAISFRALAVRPSLRFIAVQSRENLRRSPACLYRPVTEFGLSSSRRRTSTGAQSAARSSPLSSVCAIAKRPRSNFETTVLRRGIIHNILHPRTRGTARELRKLPTRRELRLRVTPQGRPGLDGSSGM